MMVSASVDKIISPLATLNPATRAAPLPCFFALTILRSNLVKNFEAISTVLSVELLSTNTISNGVLPNCLVNAFRQDPIDFSSLYAGITTETITKYCTTKKAGVNTSQDILSLHWLLECRATG